jgi:hypothetical protein
MQPRFARPLTDTRTQDNNPAAGQFVVIARTDLQRVRKWNGMPQVIGFCDGTIGIFIDQNNFAADAPHHQGIRGG